MYYFTFQCINDLFQGDNVNEEAIVKHLFTIGEVALVRIRKVSVALVVKLKSILRSNLLKNSFYSTLVVSQKYQQKAVFSCPIYDHNSSGKWYVYNSTCNYHVELVIVVYREICFCFLASAKSAPVSLQRCSISLSPTVKAHAVITLGM